jgi:hypothetical protein
MLPFPYPMLWRPARAAAVQIGTVCALQELRLGLPRDFPATRFRHDWHVARRLKSIDRLACAECCSHDLQHNLVGDAAFL